jgi:hypothetical protein
LMSKAQMNSTDAYESLEEDGRKTDTALWVAENKTEFTRQWVTKGKRKWDFYAFKQTIWFIPAHCMFSSFQVLEPHETATVHLNLQVQLYSTLEVAHARDQGDSQDQVQARKPSRYSETQQTCVYCSSGLQLKYMQLLHTLPQIMYFR